MPVDSRPDGRKVLVELTCSACGASMLGRQSRLYCDECRQERRVKATARSLKRTGYKRSSENSRRNALKSRYGITLDDWDAIVRSQLNECAICGAGDRKLVPDHDHETGVVRGALCRGCNTAIGVLGDTADGVRRAVSYLERG